MDLIQYIKGNRSGTAARDVERRALESPFVADALRGYDRAGGDRVREIRHLEKSLRGRFFPGVNRRALWWAAAGAAAVALVVTGLKFGNLGGVVDDLPGPDTAPAAGAVDSPATTPADDTYNTGLDSVAVAEGAYLVVNPVIGEDGTESYPSVPRIGIRKYNEFLARSMVRPGDGVSGPVTVIFQVNRYGRPSRMRIVGFLSQEAHREAIRLLDCGSEWTPAEGEVSVIIWFP